LININQLYYGLQSTRNPLSEQPSFEDSINTSVSSILGSSSNGLINTKPINTRAMSGFRMIKPEYINDYAVNIQEKTEAEYVEWFDTVFTTGYGTPSEAKQTENAELIKEATDLDYIYSGSENWVTQKNLIDCFLTRNNLVKHKWSLSGISAFGSIYWESKEVTTVTQYINDEYVESESSRTYDGDFSIGGMEGIFNRAVPRRTKQVRYNSSLDEYYLYSHTIRTVKLKLVLTDGSENINNDGLEFIDKVKCVYDLYDAEDDEIVNTYDNNNVTLVNGAFVSLPAIPAFDVPLDDVHYYYKQNDPNRTIWTYKEFNSYQDVVDLVMQ